MSQFELNTKRLLLRSIHLSDAETIFKYRSDAAANKYQGWIPENLEDVYDFIQNRVAPEINMVNTWYQLVIMQKEKDTLIGDIGLHFIDQQEKQVEIGLTLDKEYQGMGYATEALGSVLDYLLKNLDKHRVIASIDPDNLPSIKLVERLAFRKEAHFKKSIFINGEWCDDVIYALLKEEWQG